MPNPWRHHLQGAGEPSSWGEPTGPVGAQAPSAPARQLTPPAPEGGTMKAGSGAGRRAFVTALAALALAVAGATAASAQRGSGGMGATSTKRVETPPVATPRGPPPAPPPHPPAVGGSTLSALVAGKAIAPAGAPPVVVDVIEAANRIRNTPYIWGGGHRSWSSRGYDCSGAVSYALHGGGLLSSPLVSGSFARWGAPGRS